MTTENTIKNENAPVTKGELKRELSELETRLKAQTDVAMANLKTDLHDHINTSINGLRQEFNGQIARLNHYIVTGLFVICGAAVSTAVKVLFF